MREITLDCPAWKLSGMEYHGGKTREHWIELCKVDPNDYPQYFRNRSGGYYVTDLFRSDYKSIMVHKQRMSDMLMGR